MLKILAFALLAFWQLLPPCAPTSSVLCAHPTIPSVKVKSITTKGTINQYHLAGTVVNMGGKKQTANVLQFVDIFRDGEKMNSIGVPPLKPGQSYAFGWVFERSQDSGEGTTTLVFSVRSANAAASVQNCGAGDVQPATVTF